VFLTSEVPLHEAAPHTFSSDPGASWSAARTRHPGAFGAQAWARFATLSTETASQIQEPIACVGPAVHTTNLLGGFQRSISQDFSGKQSNPGSKVEKNTHYSQNLPWGFTLYGTGAVCRSRMALVLAFVTHIYRGTSPIRSADPPRTPLARTLGIGLR